jgi:hypothetical protein
LVDGSKLDGVASLRQALLKYKPQFVRVVTERNNYKFSSLVLGIVKSEPFQTNMKSAEPSASLASHDSNGAVARFPQ